MLKIHEISVNKFADIFPKLDVISQRKTNQTQICVTSKIVQLWR
jgi:hypothetical protein